MKTAFLTKTERGILSRNVWSSTDERRWTRTKSAILFTYLCFFVFICGANATAADVKPKVAVFPIAGNADEKLRERVAFSFRQKLDREGTYEPVDGPRMLEIAGESKEPIQLKTSVKDLQSLVKGYDVDILLWGEMNGKTLQLNVFDLRQLDPLPREVKKQIDQPTDVRFVVEDVLQTLADIKKFEHPNQISITRDEKAEKLWKENPNLVVNGGFDEAGKWDAIYMSEKYPVSLSDSLPEIDKVNIYRMPIGEGKSQNVLAMNISRQCAENNGMACLSEAIKIQPKARYRLSYKYRSDAPTLHVFVKGYTMGKDIQGNPTLREIYRRQVPPSGATKGEWVTIEDDLNPQHPAMTVTHLKVDLYVYLNPGVVMFDDVQLKAVGDQTHAAKDEALDKPLTAPKSRKD